MNWEVYILCIDHQKELYNPRTFWPSRTQHNSGLFYLFVTFCYEGDTGDDSDSTKESTFGLISRS